MTQDKMQQKSELAAMYIYVDYLTDQGYYLEINDGFYALTDGSTGIKQDFRTMDEVIEESNVSKNAFDHIRNFNYESFIRILKNIDISDIEDYLYFIEDYSVNLEPEVCIYSLDEAIDYLLCNDLEDEIETIPSTESIINKNATEGDTPAKQPAQPENKTEQENNSSPILPNSEETQEEKGVSIFANFSFDKEEQNIIYIQTALL